MSERVVLLAKFSHYHMDTLRNHTLLYVRRLRAERVSLHYCSNSDYSRS